MTADDFRVPDGEIRSIAEQFSTRILSATDPEWPALRDSEISKRRYSFRLGLLRTLSSGRNGRAKASVNSMYETHWSDLDAVHHYVSGLNGRTLKVEWRDMGYEMKPQGLRHIHLAQIARAIRATGARSVLEVGSGNGNLVLALAGMFPEVRFAGVELTSSGIKSAQALLAFEEMPDEFLTSSPASIVDRTAHHRVQFTQGSADALPFRNREFSLVYTRLALEQMESIRSAALTEVTRVADETVVLIEPWKDFNLDEPGRTYIRRQGYFAASAKDLRRYGFGPVLVSDDIPQKVQFKAGPVVARRLGLG